MEPQIREVYRKFRKLYPEAVFPALYIVIGRRNSLIPIEAHELVHFQQNTDPAKAGLLFGAYMREGGADFIAKITAGRHINEAVKSYGDSQRLPVFLERPCNGSCISASATKCPTDVTCQRRRQ